MKRRGEQCRGGDRGERRVGGELRGREKRDVKGEERRRVARRGEQRRGGEGRGEEGSREDWRGEENLFFLQGSLIDSGTETDA